MILLVNGPNLNLLGEREPQIYGSTTLGEIERLVTDTCAGYGLEVRAIQSNYEGALIDFLQEHRREAHGVIINPGALTHTSYALHDCLKAMPCPVIEVHLSNIHAREEWRRQDLVSPATTGQIVGLGPNAYYLAALWHCQQVYSASQAEVPASPEKGSESTGAAPVPAEEELAGIGVSEEIPIAGEPGEYQG